MFFAIITFEYCNHKMRSQNDINKRLQDLIVILFICFPYLLLTIIVEKEKLRLNGDIKR
jgi:hypothetical protein